MRKLADKYIEGRIWFIVDPDATLNDDDDIIDEFQGMLEAVISDFVGTHYPIIKMGYYEEIGESYLKVDEDAKK